MFKVSVKPLVRGVRTRAAATKDSCVVQSNFMLRAQCFDGEHLLRVGFLVTTTIDACATVSTQHSCGTLAILESSKAMCLLILNDSLNPLQMRFRKLCFLLEHIAVVNIDGTHSALLR